MTIGHLVSNFMNMYGFRARPLYNRGVVFKVRAKHYFHKKWSVPQVCVCVCVCEREREREREREGERERERGGGFPIYLKQDQLGARANINRHIKVYDMC